MSEIVVVKLGGTTLADQRQVLAEVAAVARKRPVVLVHGGGKRMTEWLERLGVPTHFEGGLRVTDPAALEVAAAVLRGVVNSELVAALRDVGCDAVGLSGVDGGPAHRPAPAERRAGRDGRRHPARPHRLAARRRPGPGRRAARAGRGGRRVQRERRRRRRGLAAGLGARQLVLMTDVDGVRDASGTKLDSLSVDEAEALIADGTIAGGMVPKVRAALAALAWDDAEAIIADSSAPDALARALDDPDVRHPRLGARTRRRRVTVLMVKRDRHAAIRRLVGARAIGSQGELVAGLSELGFDVTQATVSRDIAELGLAKVMRGDHSVYVNPEALGPGRASGLRRAPAADPRRHPGRDRPQRPDPRPHRPAGHGQHHRPGHRRVHADRPGRHGRGRQYAHRPVPRRAGARALARPVRSTAAAGRGGIGGHSPMNKVVLAYSGGLDTSVAVAWLREQYGVDVVTLTVDVGGGSLREGVERRAMSAGAAKAYVVDARETFLSQYVWRSLQANALYQGVYPLATALARPLEGITLISLRAMLAAHLRRRARRAGLLVEVGERRYRFFPAHHTLARLRARRAAASFAAPAGGSSCRRWRWP